MNSDRSGARFKELMRSSKRDWGASKVVVGVLKADSKAAQALERALAHVDLTLPQFNVLMVLAASDGAALSLMELNGQLISTPPNTTWLTNRMKERGLVTKNRDKGDGRVVRLRLTESGWKALGAAAPIVFAAEKELLADFSRAELTTLGELLKRLVSSG